MRFSSRKYVHVTVFVFSMVYMSASHCYRMYVDYLGWTLDYTTTQMLLTLRVTMLAFNLRDGQYLEEGKGVVLRARERTHAVARLPTLLQYYSYIFSFHGFLAGPVIEYKEHEDFVLGLAGPLDARVLVKLASRLAQAACFIAGVILGAPYAVARIAEDGGGPWGVDGAAPLGLTGLPALLLYTCVGGFFHRCKFYFAWSLTDAAAVLSGLGYEPAEEAGGEPTWDRCSQFVFSKIEFAPNMYTVANAWNKRVAAWMKHYIYLRLPGGPELKRNVYITNLLGAIWHGFYPGYWLFFSSVTFMTLIGRMSRHIIRPWFLRSARKGETEPSPLKPVYDVVGSLLTVVGVNYMLVAHVVLAWGPGIAAWGNLSFIGHIVILALFPVLFAWPHRRDASAAKKRA